MEEAVEEAAAAVAPTPVKLKTGPIFGGGADDDDDGEQLLGGGAVNAAPPSKAAVFKPPATLKPAAPQVLNRPSRKLERASTQTQ